MRVFLVGGLVAVGLTAAGCNLAPTMSRSDIVAEPSACTTKRFEVYFAEGEARLTDVARQAIGLTATQLQGCRIDKVQVIGLADASGGHSANQTLSERRAIAVVEAFEAAGWPAPVFDVDGVGDQGAAMPGGVNEPMRRRTEVLVEASPRT
ncbi:OmpA family protein [Brevundimonas sp.]|uniref:OmpA family protein n=1 Tax=Brevundimonas sp. TaxID=1871086 RepID=UPI003562836B